MENKKEKKPYRRWKGHLLSVMILLVGWAVADYVLLPVYNLYATETWVWAVALLFAFGILELIFNSKLRVVAIQPPGGKNPTISFNMDKTKGKSVGKLFVGLAVAVAVLGLLCSLISSPAFHANRYARIAGEIETRDFIADTPASESISNIALMDTSSARIIGSRALGSLSELVSQFEINQSYTQINLAGSPMKVTPLEYADFFKWFNNRKEGIPGYIQVDPVANTSSYVKLNQPMHYAQSAYFGKNLYRKLRFSYRTAMFGNTYFELDDEGAPYYVTSVLKHDVFLFGGTNVKGVVTLDPCTGETAYYDIGEVPSWIDIVFDGEMLTQRYDWYGLYSGGFINSIFGNKDCKRATDDFGYKMFDDDVWVFTGVTSIVSDQSNIGFVLMNSRTAEIRYYAIPGAEEYSVMRSAEGEVQHLGYTASFPSVINIEDQPTYIMVLKDKGSLVKQYALIHVERYNIVATGETQQEVIAKYKTALAENGMLSGDIPSFSDETDITVTRIEYLVEGGYSYAYLITAKQEIYKVDCAKFPQVVLVQAGSKVTLSATAPEDGVQTVISMTLS